MFEVMSTVFVSLIMHIPRASPCPCRGTEALCICSDHILGDNHWLTHSMCTTSVLWPWIMVCISMFLLTCMLKCYTMRRLLCPFEFKWCLLRMVVYISYCQMDNDWLLLFVANQLFTCLSACIYNEGVPHWI